MMIGMSQDKLGEALGLTFQQVQKYEKGVNRIGASRLFHISKILGVPVQFFYDDFGDEAGLGLGFAEGEESAAPAASGSEFMDLLSTPEGVQLCKSFASIKDPQVRRKIVDLVRTLAAGEN
nr:helix-turn-helix transcriptional regulator [Aquisalinus luteolus]